MSIPKLKQDITKTFKRVGGLSFQADALEHLIKIIKQQGDPSLAERVLQAIDKNKLHSFILNKASIESAIDIVLKNESIESIDEECIKVIDAFDIPKWVYDDTRKCFQLETSVSLHGDASSKIDVFRNRFKLIRQRLLRHEIFSAPILPGEGVKKDYYQLTTIDDLLGDTGKKCVLGMLSQFHDGKYYLEDLKRSIQLDFSLLEQPSGLFTENAIVIAEGYLVGKVFQVSLLALPPSESREDSIKTFPGVDFFGSSIHPHMLQKLQVYEQQEDNLIVILSDVWLDSPKVLDKLTKLFRGYESIVPSAFVLIGNFTSRALVGGEHYMLSDYFDQLCNIIMNFPSLVEGSRFIFVPGPADPCGTTLNVIPRPPIPKVFTSSLRTNLKKVYFTTNPCRITYCTQDIVIFREDIANKMKRNCIIKTNIGSESSSATSTQTQTQSQSGDLEMKDSEMSDFSQHLVKTLCDESHLCPLPLQVRPIYWTFDHALYLYPLPSILVLADKSNQFEHTYNGCVCFNPSTFNTDWSFVCYRPSSTELEFCRVDDDAWGVFEGVHNQKKLH
eukprot:TRINITY_DN8173_c0_g2_i1.p1 TRINITY_DN8173_c0_g2~~TRINITY_DN8173_c0_g2_i1.p1  ORF type:complete len:559 (+),score=89.64 TRINITY_DN8173_c0_g2_i1:155-1831(+)